MYTKNFGIMPRTVNGLMDELFFNGAHRQEANALYQVPANIFESASAYQLQIVAPGLKKEDFNVAIDKNLLSISFEHKDELNEADKDGKWLRTEFKLRSFKRSFTLNEKIDTANINAKYENGILTVALPKKEMVEPTKQIIAIN